MHVGRGMTRKTYIITSQGDHDEGRERESGVGITHAYD